MAHAAIYAPVVAHIAFVMELTLVPLLLPSMRSQFGLSFSELAWVFNSYSVAIAVGVLVGGLFGDTFKTTKVFGCGVLVFLTGSLVLAASVNAEMLIVGRILQGFGAGVFSPLVPVLLTQNAPEKPGRMLILWGSLAGYVAALAPLAYSGILGVGNWNVAFGLIAALAAIALSILLWLPTSKEPDEPRREKLDYLTIFRARDLWLTLAYVFLTYGAITYFLFRLPLWLSETSIGTTSTGFIISTLWLTFSVLSALLRNKVDQAHVQTIMLAAPLLIAIGVLISYNDNPILLIGSAILVGSGLACSNAPSTQLILRHAPRGMSAVSVSLDITLARFGGIVAVAALADAGLSVAGPVICVGCFAAALCTLVIFRLPTNIETEIRT
ncbi:MFS transporter [Litoreibacter roseus]|uniref:Major facilitator superfamily (MFS) profile domain-containing protein n=1 Tax=Litoreibacter roseus TaxID=2601869 RepID=A0A6N6JCC6_9RHOB|nr:MFS transporter [Litoreibacter roseus]GFE63806.1 hypothetical protein KIN_08800 [Litoreibacter roseus]